MSEWEQSQHPYPDGVPDSEFGVTWKVSPDLLGIANSEGYFERSNPAWLATLGWTAEDLRATPFFDFLHPDDLERTHRVFIDIKQGTPALRFENRYRRKQGGYRWLSWVAVHSGSKVFCSARDVTDEKERAEALALRTAERDEIWRVSQDMLLVVDTSGVIHAVNDAWTRTLGYAPDDLVGNRFDRFIDPADISPSYAALAYASAAALPRFENRYRHKDGSWRTLAWTAAPGRELIYCVARDITDEKRRERELANVEERLRQAQKMEAVGQLTGGLAHDFNNLLAGIGASLELLELRMSQGRMEGLDRYIGTARSSTKRAAALTQRLLAFSRRQTLDPRPADANRLIAGMEDLIRRSMGPNIEVEVFGTDDLWPVTVDEPQLESALLNLCINARDAMAPNGGKLTIETANEWLDDQPAGERELKSGQYISLCVTDTGVGMPPAVAARVFDPFFTTKPLGGGTGLGLSMVYGFVRQSGGQVRICTEEGRGTTVCLLFPRHLGAATGVTEEAAKEVGQGEGESVLVIEDEPAILMFVTEQLTEMGYRVTQAADAPSGLQILQSNARVDLLITDVGLPGGMNGRQVADAARVTRPRLKVLFITGFADSAAVGNGLLEPGMEVMTKPFDMATLGVKAKEMLGR